jgi:hypothetical protein
MTQANRHRGHMTRSFTAIALAVLAGANGCAWPTDVPSSAEPMDPPAIYARWWSMTESCSGRMAPFNSVRWYRTPGSSVKLNAEDVLGYYSPSGNLIVVTDSMIDDGAGVRHEMLHALLNVTGHPRDEFLGACADLVDCRGTCISDAGKWNSQVLFDTLSVDSMNIAASVQLLPREQDGQRWVALEVTAQNLKDRAILAIPIGARFSWGVDVGGQFSTSWSASDSSMLFFAPRQTRRWYYELRVAADSTSHTIQPGRQVIFGAFGQHWTTPIEIIVSP